MECLWYVYYGCLEIKRDEVKTTAIRADGVSQQSHHHGRDMDLFQWYLLFIQNWYDIIWWCGFFGKNQTEYENEYDEFSWNNAYAFPLGDVIN